MFEYLHCVYCVNELKRNADYGGEIYTKSIGGGYGMYDGIFGVEQEAFSEGKVNDFTVRVITQLAIWSKVGNSQRDAVEWYYSDNEMELFDRMMNADPDDYDVTYIIYTPSDDCYQTCVGAYSVSARTVPHIHSWDDGTVTTEATYSAEGEKTYTCTECGETRTETIPMLVCNDHCWDNGIVTTQATYHSAGVRIYTCTNCGETRTETIPMLVCGEHCWDGGMVTTPATYHLAGVRTYTCTNCGETRTETIPKLTCTSHVWNSGTVTTAPTYQSTGVRTYTCINCGETRTEIIPKLVCTEHEFKWVIVKPASEEEAGTERYLCEECGYYTLEREIPMIRAEAQACTHPYPRDFVETVPATCCSRARGQIICRECGEILFDDYERYTGEYDPDNHTHFTETVRVEPTYKYNGVMRYTCDGCGYYYTKPIPRLVCEHNGRRVSWWFGDERWSICATCGENVEQLNTVVSTCNHIDTKKTQILIKAPTATEWGEAAMVCECGRTVSTEMLHPYSEYQITKPEGYFWIGQ